MSEDRRLLKEFLANQLSIMWISFEGLDAYLRKSTRTIDGKLVPVFDIATVVGVPPYGRGRESLFDFPPLLTRGREVSQRFSTVVILSG